MSTNSRKEKEQQAPEERICQVEQGMEEPNCEKQGESFHSVLFTPPLQSSFPSCLTESMTLYLLLLYPLLFLNIFRSYLFTIHCRCFQPNTFHLICIGHYICFLLPLHYCHQCSAFSCWGERKAAASPSTNVSLHCKENEKCFNERENLLQKSTTVKRTGVSLRT